MIPNTKFRERSQRILDLSASDRARPSTVAVREAIEAARWESLDRPYESSAGTLFGYTFFREAIRRRYAEQSVTLPSGAVRVNRGRRECFPSLFGCLPRDARLALPLPTGASVLEAVQNYFDAPLTLSTPPLEVPRPIHLPREGVEAVWLPLVSEANGTSLSYDVLCEWVRAANEGGFLLICDATLSVFCSATGKSVPSVLSVEGWERCAVELSSLSPSYLAGVGVGYHVISDKLRFRGAPLATAYEENVMRECERLPLEYNVAYTLQRAAAASISEYGKEESRRIARIYLSNAQKLAAALTARGFECALTGASPYVFGRFCKDATDTEPPSAEYLFERLGIKVLGGASVGLCDGFIGDKGGTGADEDGKCGKFMRFSGILSPADTADAVARILSL